jgi:hypothetical protein
MDNIQQSISNYFQGFSELKNWNANTQIQNRNAVLKMFSYLIIPIPVILATAYTLISLKNRFSAQFYDPQVQGVAQQVFSPSISTEKLIAFRNQLLATLPGDHDSKEITLPSGIKYKVWKKEHGSTVIVNIQPSNNYGLSQSTNKLGLSIKADGTIEDVFHENISQHAQIIPVGFQLLVEGICNAFSNLPAQPAPPPPAAAEGQVAPVSQQLFTPAEFTTFAAVLQKYNHNANNPLIVTLSTPIAETSEVYGHQAYNRYKIWYNPDPNVRSFNIQPVELFDIGAQDAKLSVRINEEGHVESVYFNGAPATMDTLGIHKKKIKAVFDKTLTTSSIYKLGSQPLARDILLVNRGLREVPNYHLEQYINLVRPMYTGIKPMKLLRIAYLQDNLQEQAGIDAGGLTRDYFDSLFSGLIKRGEPVHFTPISDEKPDLVIPQADLPVLSLEENTCYENMGKMMMCAYLSQTNGFKVSIGRHFDDGLFRAILALSPEMMNKPFNDMVLKDKASILRALLPEGTLAYIRNSMIPLLTETPFENDHQLDNAIYEAAACFQNTDLPDPFKTDDEPDLGKIKANMVAFREALMQELLSHIPKVVQSIAPTQAIARGMRSFCTKSTDPNIQNNYWKETIQKLPVEAFTRNIQGSLDREKIVGSFTIQNAYGVTKQEISKKIEWLKTWIQKPTTTDEDLARFLKFVTGSSSISEQGIKVIYEPGTQSAIPRSHTCFYQLVLAGAPSGNEVLNDRTEAKFIEALKYAIDNSGDNFNVI